MYTSRIENLARILVQYSTRIKARDRVMIIAYPIAKPLVCAVYREILRSGGYPHTHIEIEELDFIRFTEASNDQLRFVNPIAEMVAETFDVYIQILSESNTRVLSNADPERQRLHESAYRMVSKAIRERTAAGELRWVLTVYPTNAYAQDAEMSLSEYSDYVFRTTYADHDDPLEKWRDVREFQQRLVEWLKGKKEMELKGPHVDMTFSIKDRAFINDAGSYNLPDGEIFTGPVEDSVEGWIRIPYPALYRGREVGGIELRFESGKVVDASAIKNEEFLLSMLETDSGARYLGEFGIGTNKEIDRHIRNILFDEKMHGTIHIAIGAGFPESGSKNDSAIHWDMICEMKDGGQIFVDGELFYESGEFMIWTD
jgi:aminopeptidase